MIVVDRSIRRSPRWSCAGLNIGKRLSVMFHVSNVRCSTQSSMESSLSLSAYFLDCSSAKRSAFNSASYLMELVALCTDIFRNGEISEDKRAELKHNAYRVFMNLPAGYI